AWLMSLHIVSLAVWCAGLFYLPGLFAAYAGANARSRGNLRIVTRFTFIGVTSPASVLAILTGSALIYATEASGWWLSAKLLAVTGMVFFHLYCGRRLEKLEEGHGRRRLGFHLML